MPECVACGGAQFTRRQLLPGLNVDRCAGCGLLMSDIRHESPVAFFDFDDDLYARSIGVVRRRQALDIIGHARSHASAGDWLDVGCGYGFLLEAAQRAGFRVSGIEPNERAARHARGLVGDVVRQGKLVDLDVPADVISTLDVIEHIPPPDLPAFARAVHRTLRPNGIWIIKVPSTEGLFFRFAHALGLRPVIRRLWQYGFEYSHTVYFERRTLTAFLARHGFEVLAARYLEDVPTDTAIPRMSFDGKTPRWMAVLSVVPVFLINLIERVRGKSDALLVIARAAAPPPRSAPR